MSTLDTTLPALAQAIMAKPTAAAANAKRKCFRMEASLPRVRLSHLLPAGCDAYHKMSLCGAGRACIDRQIAPREIASGTLRSARHRALSQSESARCRPQRAAYGETPNLA